jgi:hypothetical protein
MCALESLLLPRTRARKFFREVETALALTDTVLQIPEFPRIEISFTNDQRYGGYTAGNENHLPTLELSIIGVTPRLTTIHEIGHLLDDAIGGFREYASSVPGSPVSQVIAVAENSSALRTFRNYEEETKGNISARRFRVLNRLMPGEIWARAFAQYIALRSNDTKLRAEVELRRSIEEGVLQNEQWEWNDYSPIAKAMDALFQTLGWLP